jgi:exopolyphosphatase/guanosine-5'-triphosphate,3'-diphosphate pyrophosphatase
VQTVIVPRWEWRTFGESFPEAAARLGTSEHVEESDEVYVLSLQANASVKVRGGTLDVKRLEEVRDDGLEQWRPVVKALFPVSTDDVSSALAALGIEGAALARSDYSLEQFLDEVVRPRDDLRDVAVHKRRAHFSFEGCMAELSELRVEAGSRATIAVEDEDPERVVAAVRALGFEPGLNVNVPRGLNALVGFGSARYAVIDVGTNSVKFHIGELHAEGTWTTLVDRAEVTRLGEGLDASGRLGEEPQARTVDAIAAMVDDARHAGVVEIAAVGTAGLRIAANSADFLAAVRERTGVDVEVISGEDEARLAYLAATSGLAVSAGSLAVFDTGGGSSQFTFGRPGQIEERFSVNVGAARFTERFGLDGVVDDATLAAARDAIDQELSRLDGRVSPDTLVGMGGAVTNIAAVKHELARYDASAVQGTVLAAAEIDRQIELYRTRTAEQRRDIVGLQPNRAEVILAGACIVRTVLAKLGRDSFTVSDRGLRYGLLDERFTRDRAGSSG